MLTSRISPSVFCTMGKNAPASFRIPFDCPFRLVMFAPPWCDADAGNTLQVTWTYRFFRRLVQIQQRPLGAEHQLVVTRRWVSHGVIENRQVRLLSPSSEWKCELVEELFFWHPQQFSGSSGFMFYFQFSLFSSNSGVPISAKISVEKLLWL